MLVPVEPFDAATREEYKAGFIKNVLAEPDIFARINALGETAMKYKDVPWFSRLAFLQFMNSTRELNVNDDYQAILKGAAIQFGEISEYARMTTDAYVRSVEREKNIAVRARAFRVTAENAPPTSYLSQVATIRFFSCVDDVRLSIEQRWALLEEAQFKHTTHDGVGRRLDALKHPPTAPTSAQAALFMQRFGPKANVPA